MFLTKYFLNKVLTSRYLINKTLIKSIIYKNFSAISNKSISLSLLKTISVPQIDFNRDYSAKKGKDKGKKILKPKVELRDEEINIVINYDDLKNGMHNAIESLKAEYNDNVKLQVSPSSFEEINIKTPDGNFKLGEIAQVEVKSPNLYVIDLMAAPDYVKLVFDAIISSKLHLNPKLDQTTISLPIAKITREHRENLAKTIKLKCEQALKKIRDIENKASRKARESKKGSSDLIFNVGQYIKYQTEVHTKLANDLKDAKIKEILGD